MSSEVEVFVVFALYGVLGYWLAVRTKRSIGTTPWRLPAIAWAFVSAFLAPFGLLLELLARFTTRHAGPGPGYGAPPFGRSGGFGADRAGSPGSGGFGARPYGGAPYGPGGALTGGAPWPGATPGEDPANPAGGPVPWPESVGGRPGPDGWVPGSAPAPPLFGWYQDPDRQHEERYWDGRVWSDHVRDKGASSIDPLSQVPASPWSMPGPGGGDEASSPSEGVLDDAHDPGANLGDVKAHDPRPNP